MIRTDGVGLDFYAILDVHAGWVVRVPVAEDALSAEGVDEGGSACQTKQDAVSKSHLLNRRHLRLWMGRDAKQRREAQLTSARCSANHQAELDTLLHVLLAANHLLFDCDMSVMVQTKGKKGDAVRREEDMFGMLCARKNWGSSAQQVQIDS